MARDFDGVRVLVTGGASGIGAATVDLLSTCGAYVVVLDLHPGSSPRGRTVQCDLSSSDQTAAAVNDAVEALGGLDVLVNCAGIGAVGDLVETTDDEWRRILDVNVIGTARACRAAVPHLLVSTRASIVNVCSTIAFVGVPQRVAYSASKGAVASLTLAMAADYMSRIRVNAVAPGTTDTPWVDRLLADSEDPEAAVAALRRRQPLGRLVTPREVAHAIASLASPSASATTGAIVSVDGGMAAVRIPQRSES